ncbi:MAG TPA: hypothetical protein VFU89_01395 [Rhabdochlamydiaceae bacterium]|nr:hypothetical protein [Rhabdochlamydiaceae bacterium]
MKAVELALKAGRKRQSEITRFVHCCLEHPEKDSEAIPTYENFCFALALLRSRIADHVLEAKALLEKLLAFQVNGELPVYLHEYPLCRYAGLKSKLTPVIFFILRDFHSVLGEKLRAELQAVQGPLQASLEEIVSPESPEEWAEFLIHSQITGKDKSYALEHWDSTCLSFIGPQRQERGEPALTLYDLFLGQWGGKYSTRALQDHPVHLRASLIYPAEITTTTPAQSLQRQFWGNGSPTHSLLLNTQGALTENEGGFQVTLQEKEVQDEIEIACFYNLHPDTTVTINHQKATSFQLGDTIQIVSKERQIELSFRLISGEGRFWGHLYRGNRPGQLCCKGEDKHEAFDGVIGLRTIERNTQVNLEFFSKVI